MTGPLISPAPTLLTARSPADLLAVAPVVLGFWPRESVVMLTLGIDRAFHARLDLPSVEELDDGGRAGLEDALLTPARRHRVPAVVLLYFTDRPDAARAAHAVLDRACRRARIAVPVAVAADGEHYVDLTDPGRGGVPYDPVAHPFVREAVAAGRLAHASREDMVASLDPDPAAQAAVAAALAAAGHGPADLVGPARWLPSGAAAVRAQGDWVAATVARAVASGAPPPPADVARMVWVVQVPRVRDAAWSLIDQDSAEGHVQLWTSVVRGTPQPLLPVPATLLGWAAWQAGAGALAWAALDRCRSADPSYPLAGDLALLLQHAVPPDIWTGGFDWARGLPPPSGGAH